ncbi:MAG: hypothetical protein MUF00_14475 [Gemmatimonadaceae bacterium]|jgi:hypothetical protein|nr:hypothetical protein [Gemmatimonadaceae bacterium]
MPTPGAYGARQCAVPDSGRLLNALAFADAAHALTVISVTRAPGAPEASMLARVHLRDGATEILHRGGRDYRSSRDGRWVASRAENGRDLVLIPTAAPGQTRTIIVPPGTRAIDAFAFAQIGAPQRPVSAVRFADSRMRVSLDGTYQLTVDARDDMGKSAKSDGALFTAIDTLVATVDAFGVVRPRALGSARVTVALGLDADTATIEVAAPSTTTLFDERWTGAVDSRWQRYGDPAPRIGRARDGSRALLPNGDATYSSGVVARAGVPLGRGVGIEAEVEVPVTRLQWQNVAVALITGSDAMIGTAFAPDRVAPGDAPLFIACSVNYPAGEGQSAADRLVVSGGQSVTIFGAAPEYARGVPFRIQLQALPDGRCVVAVDGKVLAVRQGAAQPGALLRPHITGSAVGTEVRVRSVRMWTGVRPDLSGRTAP